MATLNDLPMEVMDKIGASLSAKDRVCLLCCCNKLLRSLASSADACMWGKLSCEPRTPETAASLALWLARHGHSIQGLTLNLYYLRNTVDAPERHAAALVGALSSAGARLAGHTHIIDTRPEAGSSPSLSCASRLTELCIQTDDRPLLLEGAWLAGLPALCTLTVYADARLDLSFSQLSSLTSLELHYCQPDGMPAGCLPSSLRSLGLSLSEEQRCLPAAVGAATGLRELAVSSLVDEFEGLQNLAGLTSLAVETIEAGIPEQVSALSALRWLSVAPDAVYDWQLGLLSGLTSLSYLSLEAEDGGMIFGPLPGALLALPALEEMRICTQIPASGMEELPADAPPPTLHSLSICIATAAASPATVATLTSLTKLHLFGLYDEDNCPPLTVAAVTTLMAVLGDLPRLQELDWVVCFPTNAPAGVADAAEGDAGAAGAAGAAGEGLAAAEAAAGLDAGAAAGAAGEAAVGQEAAFPHWVPIWGYGCFPCLKRLRLEFSYPGYLEGSTRGAKDLVPWLGMASWLAGMRRLEHVSVIYAGEAEEALRAAAPAGLDFRPHSS